MDAPVRTYMYAVYTRACAYTQQDRKFARLHELHKFLATKRAEAEGLVKGSIALISNARQDPILDPSAMQAVWPICLYSYGLYSYGLYSYGLVLDPSAVQDVWRMHTATYVLHACRVRRA